MKYLRKLPTVPRECVYLLFTHHGTGRFLQQVYQPELKISAEKNAARPHVSTNICIHPEIILKIKLDNYQIGEITNYYHGVKPNSAKQSEGRNSDSCPRSFILIEPWLQCN